MSEKRYVVSVSGGLTSFEAWRRTVEKHGRENVTAIFADVGTVVEDGEIVCGEDEDLFRFLDDTERLMGHPIIRLRHPKYANIWEAFFGERFLGNTMVDTCSKFLKREVIARWIKENAPDATMVLGFSWLESSRARKYQKRIPNSWMPLQERPYVINDDIAKWLLSRGVKPPRNYELGASHNNCGLFCVKSGLGQLYLLWKLRIKRYLYNERMELKFRAEINPKATIFRKNGKPITMQALRLLFEQGYIPKTAPDQGCGGRCMVPEQDELNLAA